MVLGRRRDGPGHPGRAAARCRPGPARAAARPAHVEASTASLERSAQAAQVAELRAAAQLAEKRLERLQALVETRPRRDIEVAQSELLYLRARIAALAQGLGAREALRAPVDGVIASAHAVVGQVLDAREAVFEVVDPRRLRIEALAYEPALAADVGAAFLVAEDGRTQALRFLGAGHGCASRPCR